MTVFFRAFKHLLPRAAAWLLTPGKLLTDYFTGLANGAPVSVKTFLDEVYEDLRPETTRELEEWERQFGLPPALDDDTKRLNVAAEWAARGGQSPYYLQTVLQAAGFPVYVHEWWESGPPWVARDPRLYTNQPLVGTVQCGEPLAQCGELSAVCNRLLANETFYLVNKDLTQRAPPPVPDDPAFWPYFLYIGGETFPDRVVISVDRQAELERLLLKIAPAQQWLVLLVDSVAGLVTEGGDALTTEAGDPLTTE